MWNSRRGGLFVTVGLFVLLALTGCARARQDLPSAAPASAPRDAPAPGSLREIHASLDVELPPGAHVQAARDALDETVKASGGYVQSAAFGADDAPARMTARVPTPAIDRLRATCRGAGRVTRDEETQTDVTEAIADTEARLVAARTEETRLLALISDRTGSVADVLAAERALADVRERVERLDAESRAARARVELATVEIGVTRGAAADGVAAQLADAARDGARWGKDLALGSAVLALRLGPSATFLGLIGASALMLRRWRRRLRLADGVSSSP
jgi:hypothetical protein